MKLRLGWMLLALVLLGNNAFAFQKRTITQISFGSYQVSDSEANLYGTRLAVGVKQLLDPNWAWFGAVSQGDAIGSEKINGIEYESTASSTALTGGGEWRTQAAEDIEPFVGLGMIAESYSYDFTSPGSKTGKTSGTGLGPMSNLGVRFQLGQSFIFIPTYQYSLLRYQTEAGDNASMISSGLYIALVFRF